MQASGTAEIAMVSRGEFHRMRVNLAGLYSIEDRLSALPRGNQLMPPLTLLRHGVPRNDRGDDVIRASGPTARTSRET